MKDKEHRKYQRLFKIARALGKPIVCAKYHYSYQSFKDVEGPYLLLANHTTDIDSPFVGIASGRQMYFVATENLIRMPKFGKLIKDVFAPIIHYKGTVGVKTTKEILKHLRSGHSVGMFPEGNRTFSGKTLPIREATGKLARMCGAKLVTFRIRGGYFTSPRWHKKDRVGRVKGEVAGVYTHEQLMEMTPEEVNDLIARDLYVDAYADQAKDPVPYKGEDIAEALESAIFLCPECGKIGGLHSKGDRFFCDCGFESVMDEYGYLTDEKGIKRTVTELDEAQKAYIAKLLENAGDEELFSDEVSEEIVGKDHEIEKITQVTFRAFKDRYEINDRVMNFDDIEAIAINQRNLLMIHVRGEKPHYQYRGQISFNALKYLYLFRDVKGSVTGLL